MAADRTTVLLSLDFESPLPPLPPHATRPTPGVGTIVTPDTDRASHGLLLTSKPGDPVSTLTTGPLPIANPEAHLGKLTVGFDLSASAPRPVRFRVRSYDAALRATGALETVLYPAAADFYQRYAVDLSTLTPVPGAAFEPTAPHVAFEFEIDAAHGWPADRANQLRVDNLEYARPAYYVSPAGSDGNDGRSEATAFATPQRALDLAGPGDIVLLMEGTYAGGAGGRVPPGNVAAPVAYFPRPGTPAGWITLKNYPGHRPVLHCQGRHGVSITWNAKGTPEQDVKLSYIEVRGLHFRGDGDAAQTKYPADLGRHSANTDAVGIYVNGRSTPYPGVRGPGEIIHHVRLADNVVEYCAADGIYIEYVDHLYIENNKVFNNCWATIGFAPAGLSVMGYANFDTVDNVPKMLITRNEIAGNKLTQMNQPYGEPVKTYFFNGNGMLLDANAEKPPAVYLGRTLVQNNVVYFNGAAGIQLWGNHRMDLVNNTVYLNGTVIPWGQFGFDFCRDVRVHNNIVVGRAETPLDCWFDRPDRDAVDIRRTNNLFAGGKRPALPGVNTLVSDPALVRPVAEPGSADYRPGPGSPAVGAGEWQPYVPSCDFAGKPRPHDRPPTLGAIG